MSEVKIKEVMIKNVYTIGLEEKIALARLKMLRYGVHALPVEKEYNSLVRMLTLLDISLLGMNIGNLQIKDLMTKNNLITGTSSTKLAEIIDLISKTEIQRIPIVDADGKMNGLMTQKCALTIF